MKNSLMNREFYDLSNGVLFAKIGPLVAEISPKMCFKWGFTWLRTTIFVSNAPSSKHQITA